MFTDPRWKAFLYAKSVQDASIFVAAVAAQESEWEMATESAAILEAIRERRMALEVH